ncbi:MAG: porin family protein [Candidatus Eisenbacteria bacterium]|nr:porin family protein [Candidatus Eisenbacteria bacterium]
MKMLEKLIVVVVLLAGTAAASAAGEVSVGVKGGVITSNVTGIPEQWGDAQDYRISFTGGVFLNYAFDDALSLQPELLYTPKGFKGNLYDGFIDVDATPMIDFLELPVLVKYTFPGARLRPCIFAGPSLGFVVDSNLKISAGWLATNIDISRFTNDTDFGIVAGAGLDYETSYGVLTFDARYQRGFANIIESAEFEINGSPQTITVDQFKHYGFSFMMGYRF